MVHASRSDRAKEVEDEDMVSVKGLHIEGYSVPCVLDARDGIPLKEI